MAVKVLILSKNDRYHLLEELGSKILDWLKELEEVRTEVSHDKGILASRELDTCDICILCTTMGDLTAEQEEGIVEFVEDGKNLFGIHSATVINEERKRYISLIGGRFTHHPPRHEFQVRIEDKGHPITGGIEDFKVTDELYILDRAPEGAHILATALCEGKAQPLLYAKRVGKGKVLYNALGHDQATYNHPIFRRLVIQGIQWMISR